jgi:hypothetical protein
MARNEVIQLKEEDFKVRKFTAAPAGTYTFLITKKSKIKRFKSGGRGLELQLKIVADGKGKKTKVTGTVFDNILVTVTWKVGQLLAALKIKKLKITLEELLKLVTGKKLRALVRIERFEGKNRNKVVQYLPLTPSKDEDVSEDDNDADEDDADDADDADGDSDDDAADDSDDSDDEDEDTADDDEDANEDEDEDSSDEDEDADADEDADEDEDADADEDEDEKPRRRGKVTGGKKRTAPAKRPTRRK